MKFPLVLIEAPNCYCSVKVLSKHGGFRGTFGSGLNTWSAFLSALNNTLQKPQFHIRLFPPKMVIRLYLRHKCKLPAACTKHPILDGNSVSCRGLASEGGPPPPQIKILGGGAKFWEKFFARAFGARRAVLTYFGVLFSVFEAIWTLLRHYGHF